MTCLAAPAVSVRQKQLYKIPVSSVRAIFSEAVCENYQAVSENSQAGYFYYQPV